MNKCPVGIELPIGECNKIHLTSKKVQLQVKHRPYLSDQICPCSPDACKSIGKTALFYKEVPNPEKSGHDLGSHQNTANLTKRWDQFFTAFSSTIVEFAHSQREKVSSRVIKSDKDQLLVWKRIMERENLPEKRICAREVCDAFTDLIEVGDVDILLGFSDETIKLVFACQHGGQAVGNNIQFLLNSLWTVYFYTNLIMMYGLENQPEKWGPMTSSKRNFRTSDCDGQGFLSGSRKFLGEEVYMKDLVEMKTMCKSIFRFFYLTEMLWREVYKRSYPWENIAYMLNY